MQRQRFFPALISRPAAVLLLLVALRAPAPAQQPAIFPHGVVNSASFAPFGLPNGSIALGSVFTVFGQNLGPAKPVTVAGLSFPLPLTLGGVTVAVFQGSTSVSAVPLFASATQINAVMPSNAPLGKVSVQVAYSVFKSNPSPVTVVNDSFGIFSGNGSGQGPGSLQNFITQQKQPVNSPSGPAKPKQTITLWGTGLGPVLYGDNVAPKAGSLPTKVEVWVGDTPASVQYSGRSPCCAGIDQIVFQVPAAAPSGCWVPVQVRTGGATPSNVVTMAISPGGSACSETANPFAQHFLKGANVGLLSLVRLTAHEDVGVAQPVDATQDGYFNSITRQAGSPFAYLPFVSEPPAGSCTVYMGSGDFFNGDTLYGDMSTGSSLQFGAITLEGPQKSASLQGDTGDGIAGMFGSSVSGYPVPDTTYLVPGNFTFLSGGGAQVGSFKVSVTMPSAFIWAGQMQLRTVNRTQPLTLSWSGAPANQSLAIFGINVDRPTNSSAAFYCMAPPGAASFTIPPQILESLPATRANAVQSRSGIYLGNMPLGNAVPFTASGLDFAAARAVLMIGKTVVFQ